MIKKTNYRIEPKGEMAIEDITRVLSDHTNKLNEIIEYLNNREVIDNEIFNMMKREKKENENKTHSGNYECIHTQE